MTIYDHQDRDESFIQSESVTLADGEKGVVTFSPSDRTSQYFLRSVLISKRNGTTYEIELDDSTLYPESSIPPSDIDDSTDTFQPPEVFEQEIEITVRNVSGAEETYRFQVAGWERRRYTGEPEGVPW